MARLHLFVDGQPEQTFADTLLKRHLANFGAETIGLENIRFKCPHFKRWIERLEKLGAKSLGEP